VVRTHRDIAKADRVTQRNNRRQVDRIADMRRAKDRADLRTRNRIGRDVARNGRFAGTNFANRNFARVRFAGWSPQRAWRRGLLAAFIPWAGAVYMPYIYNDMFDYTFWPTGYHSGYWAYAYDDFFDGIWWAGEPTYVTEAQTFRPASSGPALSGAGSIGSTGVRPQDPDDREDRLQPQGQGGRVTAATTGEGACGETGRGLTAWPFDRIKSSLDLNDDQQDLLDELRDAAVQAADALRDSCPKTQPRNAVDRLQAMLDRLEGTLEAVKYVRPAMEAFYNSLDDDQRERFQELGPKLSDTDEPRTNRARPGSDSACGKAKPGLANFPIERIQETVSLQDDQLDLLDALEDATIKALDIMKAACPDDPPLTASERLKATQTRIEAMLQAAKVIQPALDDFYSALNDQQKTQFNSMKG
jgi:hypothetical protein